MPARATALLLIRIYQRYISPYKGFHCAYRCHTGRASCSALGYRVIRRFGAVGGIALLRMRLKRCSDIHAISMPPRPWRYQRGDCDPGCDPDCLDFFDCCSCDWPSRSKKNPKSSKKRSLFGR
ncbi:membrane protein insertion efficiency factor YidD [Chitinibacter sp. S2-10]|uniref:membrane protein insertion efficiency factor YidD n=1 Tax=Chitinibacter sp. S2-10 TaxID=3373597 RepID=UPI0039777E6C